MLGRARLRDVSAFAVPIAVRLRRGSRARQCRRTLLLGSFALVVVMSSCGETSSGGEESPAPTTSSSSPIAEPSQGASPALIRLAVAARRYESVANRYLALYEDPSRLAKAFDLLKPMEHAFEIWNRAATVAAEEQAVQIPPDALRRWAAAFRAWLGNQAAQSDALIGCAAGEPITDLTVIECLYTIGPLVHRGEKLSDKLNTLLDSELSLAGALSGLRF
jgi:hypothetical protein